MKRTIVLVAAVAALLAPAAVRADPDLSGLEPVAGATPQVLSAEDVRRYREIFADEAEGRFDEGRALIADLSDRSLMGYVEAEHYLSPHERRPAVADLAKWLDEYAELPVAERIRALAEEREPRRRRHRVALPGIPAIPVRAVTSSYETTDSIADPPLATEAARTAQLQIDGDVKLDQPAAAEAVLQQLASLNMAPPSDIARLTHHVAASYLAEGQDDDALRMAGSITGIERDTAPLLDWVSGLAAYRLGKFADAAPSFEHLAQNGTVPGWTRSAAAFWAARAHLAAGDPLPVVSLLTAAAREQPTFYGLLAQHVLGLTSPDQFSDPVLDAASFDELMRIPAAHRAVALWQVGHTDGIEPEMRRAFAEMDTRDAAAFAALSHRLDLPDLELRASEAQVGQGELLTGLFPVPQYTPPGGYHIDPCLVLAFARVESRFQPKAVSTAGARGVMQLMPGTAQLVDGTKPGKALLNDPSYNLGLGERYLQSLIEQTNGNLLQLAAAYNAGPAALTRWLATRPEITSDPLLFIESIPYPETRSYIKYVMTYYWMYAKRTNESAPTLDETAAGQWPTYQATAAVSAKPAAPQKPAGTLLISDASAPH
ncbi:MAG TPA: lytic transglycosylase domain-containing protein [Rhizomicrobium sp.]|jgi:soluble lytic murein transglycosylase-like protein|nr:lytic transglycosylase domain-containing protein [Rhizomicrobium sp.]